MKMLVEFIKSWDAAFIGIGKYGDVYLDMTN